jgi:rod shape determining protein RodA
MNIATSQYKKDIGITVAFFILVIFSIVILRGIAPFVFPTYFVYLIVAVISFLIFSQIDFDILSTFDKHFYIGSILFLILPLIIGQVTRGVVRWIPLGPVSIQPSELVRPYLFVFFANRLTKEHVRFMDFIKTTGLFLIAFVLILIQPSLGVSILTAIGYLGIVLATTFNKKYLISFLIFGVLLIPLFWHFLKPYQRSRIVSFDNYNSVQATISVGSGKMFGEGLGKGTETQLTFLPEKQTDFIFASVAHELGFLGAGIVLLVLFFLLPITGVTLPLVSAGGSSLVATATMLGMVIGAKKD